MVIKWKNKIKLIVFLLLFTFGLSGILSAFSNSNLYLEKDYFETNQFDSQLNEFIDYLSIYELNYISPEKMKKEIIVTAKEIDEHRYRYGSLADQTANIHDQYEQKIQEALSTENNDIADNYIAERDKKIEDIANNFRSDEYVKAKIIKEKEQEIDTYYSELESYRSEYAKLKSQFTYYLKDILTNEVYTNLQIDDNAKISELINSKNMRFIRNYPEYDRDYLSAYGNYNTFNNRNIIREYVEESNRIFKGKIAIPNSATITGSVLSNYHEYQKKQMVFPVYAIISVLMFLASIYIYKKSSLIKISLADKWQTKYNNIPIDLCIVLIIFIGYITLAKLSNGHIPYLYKSLYSFIRNSLFDLVIAIPLLALTIIQGRLLYNRIKNSSNLHTEWKKSFIYNAIQRIREVFLNRSVGFQVLFLLAVAFCTGFGIVPVILESELLLIYLPLLIIISIPTLILIIKRTGYLNKIANYSSELANGNMEPDLAVKGKSVLATLANNLNKLKYGVKTSQNEQAKSERLKTELITNVSHDLRTPLTSIITYTELLKTPDLTNEDRAAYIQIIDKKSKRLKVLIDDLFEASKMVSGNIELVKEKVDIVQLLQQALAEHEELISQSTLQFKVSTPEKPLYAVVDGQKMWRVFDNLINNIVKYSLENTRVYISTKIANDIINIEFKNIAKYELNIAASELYERFKRGDASRHTDGSGLGLAIAKSIVDLHEGSLDIDIDGDLFKATVKLNQ